jgi:hypothetical protein
MRKAILGFVSVATSLSLFLSACNLPTTPVAEPTTPPLPATEPPAAVTVELPTPVPTEMSTLTPTEIPHTMVPGDVPGGTRVYDNESYSTASLNYAASGDWYEHNRFERPFTPNGMNYLSYIDIQTFNISKDARWFFVSVELADLVVATEGYEPVFGVEVDNDLDGRGNFLLWVTPPLEKEWSVKNLKVFRDANHDVGGSRPDQMDGKKGNGYETLIFDAGQGDDPDLAWVRADPVNVNFIQFAFKQTMIGNPTSGFEAAIWADASNLKDPAQFAYNDLMAIELAGSPLKGDANYPIKAVYAVDSTCYRPFGTTGGYAPLICPVSEEKAKRPPRKKPSEPGGPTPAACVPNPFAIVAVTCP